ncbi:hypothetical protein KKA17_07115 [bacterium]|nr:hypothetical protein [bacterium]MBU1883357.1 hypothetical protein [bacterium]
MTSIMILLQWIIGIYVTILILKGIKYYRLLSQEQKDWINDPKMDFSEWYKGLKFWRYMNIPDDGSDSEFTKLNNKIKPLAFNFFIASTIYYVTIFLGFLCC